MDIGPKLGLKDEIFVTFKIYDFCEGYDFLLGMKSMKKIGVNIDIGEDIELKIGGKLIINGKIIEDDYNINLIKDISLLMIW